MPSEPDNANQRNLDQDEPDHEITDLGEPSQEKPNQERLNLGKDPVPKENED